MICRPYNITVRFLHVCYTLLCTLVGLQTVECVNPVAINNQKFGNPTQAFLITFAKTDNRLICNFYLDRRDDKQNISYEEQKQTH